MIPQKITIVQAIPIDRNREIRRFYVIGSYSTEAIKRLLDSVDQYDSIGTEVINAMKPGNVKELRRELNAII